MLQASAKHLKKSEYLPHPWMSQVSLQSTCCGHQSQQTTFYHKMGQRNQCATWTMVWLAIPKDVRKQLGMNDDSTDR